MNEGKEYSPEEIVSRVVRFKEYFGSEGGITVSGGEPLLQADAVRTLFELCHENAVNTCLDTSGSIMNDKVKALLDVTDRVLLDIKYTDEELYRAHVGCGMQECLEFLDYLSEKNIPVTLRQVIIPGLNDNEENIAKLKEIADSHKNVDKWELLAFRKICQVKYDKLGIEFPFGHISEPTKAKIDELSALLAP